MRLWAFAIPAALALATGLPADATAPKALRVHLAGEEVTLDWTQSAHEVDLPLILNLQEGLTALSRDLKPVPMMAKFWSYDDSGTSVRFVLRKDIFWSDGKPVVAGDFVAAVKRLLSPLNHFSTAYYLFGVRGAQEYAEGREPDFAKVGVTAPSDTTLIFYLNAPDRHWVENTALPSLYPFRDDVYQKKQNLWTRPGNLVTNGPYQLSSHTIGEEFMLTRNKYYRLKSTNIDRIHFVISSYEKALQSIRDGSLDVILQLPTFYRKQLEGMTGVRVVENRPNCTRKLDFNLTRNPTSSRDFRYAIAAAIDRRELVGIDRGLIPGSSYVPPYIQGNRGNAGVPYNPQLARQLFDKTAQPDTRNLTLEMLVPAFDENKVEALEVAKTIQKKLKQVLNLDVKLEIAEDVQRYLVLRDNGQYHLLLRDYNVNMADPLDFYAAYASDSRFRVKWPDHHYDDLLDRARRAPTDDKRLQALKDVDEFLVKEQVILIPLFYRGDLTVMRSGIEGLGADRWLPYYLSELKLVQ